jgi:hypothetical protein
VTRLTYDPATELRPAWSIDGNWIYYSSNRSGRYEIWKSPATGGAAVQITHHGGIDPAESVDGKYVFYLASQPNQAARTAWTSNLNMVPADGGEERALLDYVRRGLWGVTARGLLLLRAERDSEVVVLYRFPEGTVTRLGKLPFPVPRQFGQMSFSPEGQWALTNQVDRRESDLMLIRNFH